MSDNKDLKSFELIESEVVRLKGLHRTLLRRQDAEKIKAAVLYDWLAWAGCGRSYAGGREDR